MFCKKGKKIKTSQEAAQVLLQVFSCEFCEIWKITYVVEHLRTAAFGISLLKNDAKKHRSNYKILDKISEATARGVL